MRHRMSWTLLATIGVAACGGGQGSPTSPGKAVVHSIAGIVTDDSGYLRNELSTISEGVPVSGVRVEVVDGAQAGASAVTDESGQYRIGGLDEWKSGHLTVRYSKPGWETAEYAAIPDLSPFPARVQIGQAPHTVWGFLLVAGSNPPVYVAGARVEIIDGSPNVGKFVITDASGAFRFDGEPKSRVIGLRATRAGYKTSMFGSPVNRTVRIRVSLEPD